MGGGMGGAPPPAQARGGGSAIATLTTRPAQATYKFEAANEHELSFDVGDVLNVIQEDPSGWWAAELHGRVGLIPHNYVVFL
mmetsp:Transcript_41109/g.103617  ORF Transcript_41109/g.103617 Transcript_41109/m.103617 type:complete len:82 (+) Transcript_41109:3-248(+)